MTTATARELTQDNFQQQVLDNPQPVLVDVWAQWCAPCRQLSPVIDNLAQQYAGHATVAKLDADANRDLALQYEVTSLPTVLLFHRGQLVERLVGLQPQDVYQARLDAMLEA